MRNARGLGPGGVTRPLIFENRWRKQSIWMDREMLLYLVLFVEEGR